MIIISCVQLSHHYDYNKLCTAVWQVELSWFSNFESAFNFYKQTSKAQSGSSHIKLTFSVIFLSSSLYLFRSLSTLSLQALPVSSTFLSSELKSRLKASAILSHSAGEFGLAATTSVASWRLWNVLGHRRGAITVKPRPSTLLFFFF